MTAREILRRWPNASKSLLAANQGTGVNAPDLSLAQRAGGHRNEAERGQQQPAREQQGTSCASLGEPVAPIPLRVPERVLRQFKVVLPPPPTVLRANGSTRNHMYRASEIKRYRKAAMLAGLSILPVCKGPMLARASLQLTWYRRSGRKMDAVNLMHGAGIKAAIDGLTDANYWKDDACVTPLEPRQVTDPHPRIELLISELP